MLFGNAGMHWANAGMFPGKARVLRRNAWMHWEKSRDVFAQCMGALAKCRDVSAPIRVLNPESMDVLLKCRDVSEKSMPATPSEVSATRRGSATHAADIETEGSFLPAPRNVVIRMLKIAPSPASLHAMRGVQHAGRQSYGVRSIMDADLLARITVTPLFDTVISWLVIPAKAGIQFLILLADQRKNWIPAFAGMTACSDVS